MKDLPKIDSVWRNLKKGTLYRVWAIAGTSPFVIYQAVETVKPDRDMYCIQHSEDGRLGIVYLMPSAYGLRYNVSWYDCPVIVSGKPEKPIAWGRPLHLWYEKFEKAIT